MGKIITGIYEAISSGDFDVDSDFEQVTARKHISVLDFFKQMYMD